MKNRPFQGHSKEREDVLDRFFKGYPENCTYALGCRRQIGARHAVFLRTVAYVDVPCTSAEVEKYGSDRKVLRYVIPAASRRQIAAFDTGGVVEKGAFRLKAPTTYERIDRPRRESKGPGGHVKKNGRNVDSLLLDGVRNGSGHYLLIANRH